MSRNREKRLTLLKQIQNNLNAKLAIGESKKADKIKYLRDENGELIRDTFGQKIVVQEDFTHDKIYSWSTYKAYLARCNQFAQWCRKEFNCKTLKQCEAHRNEYIQKLIDENKSAYTIKLNVCALSKLYNLSSKDFIETPARQRQNITRSRGIAVRDKDFSVKNNAELINFCRCCGLRRAELKQLRGTDLIEKDGRYFLHVHTNTKGGKERISPVVGTDEEVKAVVDRMKSVGKNKVWEKVNGHADIHGYRSDYCTRVYNLYARDEKTITDKSEIYCCKNDLAGVHYDKKAMLIASQALGHNRINVIASNYLRGGAK